MTPLELVAPDSVLSRLTGLWLPRAISEELRYGLGTVAQSDGRIVRVDGVESSLVADPMLRHQADFATDIRESPGALCHRKRCAGIALRGSKGARAMATRPRINFRFQRQLARSRTHRRCGRV